MSDPHQIITGAGSFYLKNPELDASDQTAFLFGNVGRIGNTA
jgi:hypothetical protein